MTEPSLETILQDIRSTVDERRTKGDYPPGLEQELKLQFDMVSSRSHEALTNSLEHAGSLLAEARSLMTDLSSRPADSRSTEIAVLLGTVLDIIAQIHEVMLLGKDADSRLVEHLAKSVLEKLCVVDHLAILTVDLERRVNALQIKS